MATSKIPVSGYTPNAVLTIPSNTYASYALALAQIAATINTLSTREKINSYLLIGDEDVYQYTNLHNNVYNRTTNTSGFIRSSSINLTNKTFITSEIKSSGFTSTDNTNTPQTLSFLLVVREWH